MAVRLLRAVRADNGQDFMEDWVVGFTPESALALVAAGYAVRLDAPRAPVQPAKQPEPPKGFQVSNWAPVSHGLSPDAPKPQPTGEPAPVAPSNKRRR